MSHDERHETHERVRTLLDDYVDGTLSAAPSERVEAHLHECDLCRNEVDSVRALVDAASALPSTISSENDFWPDLEKRIRQRPVLVVAGGQPSPPSTPAVRPMWPRWARGGVAAAAVILVVTAVVWFAGRDAGLGTRAFRSPAVATSSPESPRMLPAVVRGLEIECMGAGKLLQASVRRDGARAQSIAESLHLGVSDVDRCIEETLAALEARPDDPRLVKQLTFRYQQKLDLLLGAMRRVEDV